MQSYQKDVAKTLFGTRRMSNSCTRRMFKCAMLKWFLYFTKASIYVNLYDLTESCNILDRNYDTPIDADQATLFS